MESIAATSVSFQVAGFPLPQASTSWGPIGSAVGQNWFPTILFLVQISSRPPQNNLFTAQRWSVGSVHFSLPGIIAVMIGFAANINRHVNKTVKSAGLKNASLPQVIDPV